jgi:hypothetical protein
MGARGAMLDQPLCAVANLRVMAPSTTAPRNMSGRAVFTTRTPVEAFFALLKRAVYGQFHHISEAHLHRYLAEADFKYNTRSEDDADRAAALLRGTKGKRLLYRQPDETIPN